MSAASLPLPDLLAHRETPMVIPSDHKSEVTYLKYNGTHLGRFEFRDVIAGYWPCTSTTKHLKSPVLYAYLKMFGHSYPVILKRNCSKKIDQVVVDELKGLFGLNKLGTHQIRLKGVPRKIVEGDWILPNGQLNLQIVPEWSEYFIFRATMLDGNFVALRKLEEIDWVPTTKSHVTEIHRAFFYEIQKILVFRQLLKVQDTNLNEILVQTHPEVKLWSIDEVSILRPTDVNQNALRRVKLNKDVESFFFPKTISRNEILIKMLGFTRDTYRDQIEILRNTISQIIHRVDEEYFWLIDQLVTEISDMVSVYYSLKHT